MRTSTKPIYIKEFSTLTQCENITVDSVFVQARRTLIGEILFAVYGQNRDSGRISRVYPDFADFTAAWNDKTRIENQIEEAQKECSQRK